MNKNLLLCFAEHIEPRRNIWHGKLFHFIYFFSFFLYLLIFEFFLHSINYDSFTFNEMRHSNHTNDVQDFARSQVAHNFFFTWKAFKDALIWSISNFYFFFILCNICCRRSSILFRLIYGQYIFVYWSCVVSTRREYRIVISALNLPRIVATWTAICCRQTIYL